MFQSWRKHDGVGLQVLCLLVLSSMCMCEERRHHKYVAADMHDDGLGAQLQPKLTCIMEAGTNPGLTYAHVPFKRIAHDKNASECEAWFNVGENEMALSSLPKELPEGVTLEHVSGCHGFADGHPYMWSWMKEGLRRKYFSPMATPKPATKQFRFDAINVGVHVRRGDVVNNCGLGGHVDDGNFERSRCIPTSYVAGVILQVVKKLASLTDHAINVQVFTEGNNNHGELKEIVDAYPTAGLNFNGNVLHVFHALMTSDVFIMAHSSFSLMAAVYGAPDQLVVYDKFWHSGVPKWIRVKNGTVGGDAWHWQEDYLYKQAIGMADARVAALAKGKQEKQ